MRRGDWALCTASGWPDDHSCEQLLTWCWKDGTHRALVVVNHDDVPAAAQIHLPWSDIANDMWQLEDLLSGEAFGRDGNEMQISSSWPPVAASCGP